MSTYSEFLTDHEASNYAIPKLDSNKQVFDK